MNKEIKLSNRNVVPLLGFGTFLLKNEICTNSIINAIKIGYRYIDTAVAYENEIEIGNAIDFCIKNKVLSEINYYLFGSIPIIRKK